MTNEKITIRKVYFTSRSGGCDWYRVAFTGDVSGEDAFGRVVKSGKFRNIARRPCSPHPKILAAIEEYRNLGGETPIDSEYVTIFEKVIKKHGVEITRMAYRDDIDAQVLTLSDGKVIQTVQEAQRW